MKNGSNSPNGFSASDTASEILLRMPDESMLHISRFWWREACESERYRLISDAVDAAFDRLAENVNDLMNGET